jgi:hypothetical protein
MSREEAGAEIARASSASPASEAAGNASLESQPARARRFVPIWVLTLLAGSAAGLLSAFGGEKTFDAFVLDPHYPDSYAKTSGYERAAVRAQVNRIAGQVLEMKKAAAAYGLLGLILGVAMGATGGLIGGSIRSAFSGMLVGGFSGAVLGAGGCALLIPMYYRLMDPTRGLIMLFMTYVAIFAGVGAAGGLALGCGSGDRKTIVRCVIGGLLGSLLGTFGFEVANSLAFPLLESFAPVPVEQMPRIVVHLSVAIGTALFAGLAVAPLGAQVTRRA